MTDPSILPEASRDGDGTSIQVLVLDRDRATCEAIARELCKAEGITADTWATSVDRALHLLSRDRDGAFDVVVASAQVDTAGLLQLARILRKDDASAALVVTGVPEIGSVNLQYLESGAHACLGEDRSIAGLVVILRLLSRGRVLLDPETSRSLILRLHTLADLVEETGVDPGVLERLTRREREVLDLIGLRLTNAEIAERLFIEVGTVKSHVHSVLRKMRVSSRKEARRMLTVIQAMGAEG